MTNTIEQMDKFAKELIEEAIGYQIKSDGQEVVERITDLDLEEY